MAEGFSFAFNFVGVILGLLAMLLWFGVIGAFCEGKFPDKDFTGLHIAVVLIGFPFIGLPLAGELGPKLDIHSSLGYMITFGWSCLVIFVVGGSLAELIKEQNSAPPPQQQPPRYIPPSRGSALPPSQRDTRYDFEVPPQRKR